MWSDLLLSYCQQNKIWRISKSQFFNTLGQNKSINRKLSPEAINIIFDFFVNRKHAIYATKSNDEIFVLWKSISEWEEFIYSAAVKHHRIESIETLEYIVNDDDNMTEEFYGMDKDLLVIILQGLEKVNKCMVIIYNPAPCR